ncbi:MAG: RNA polymerase sigma factor [Bacteroidales bacterium]|nr:RNA polymerase sigma factor [Bacteroidales bacterium]
MKVEKEHKGLRSFISSEYRNLVLYVHRYFNERYYDVSAEDIVQDVAVNLFSKLDFDEHLENIAGYVYRSIRNRITDFQRKSKKEISFEKFTDEDGEEYFSKNIPDEGNLFLKEIDDEKFYDSIQEALDQLSPNQQMVFVATEIDGYTFDELSDQLEIPIGTLLSWKHRGVKKLKEIIRPDDFYRENDD